MNIDYKHFGIIKDDLLKDKTLEQKLAILEKLGYLEKQGKFSSIIENEIKIREQVIQTLLIDKRNPKITYAFIKNIPTEIKNFLNENYFEILKIPCLQFLTNFNNNTFHLTPKRKRKVAAKAYKKHIHNIKASSIPNPLSNKTDFLGCAFKEKLENNSFITNNFELLENYLIGNKNYFTRELINDPVFDRFYEIETNFLIANCLNEKFKFEDFTLEATSLKLFLSKHPDFKDLFIEDVAFVYLKLLIESYNNDKQMAISLFYYLSEHNFIQNNKNKYKNFLELFFNLKISKIIVDEDNLNHKKRYDLIDEYIKKEHQF